MDTIGASDLLPGALDALDQVRRAGLGVALASASRNAVLVLERLGIRESFDVIVDPSGIPRGKPAPDLFLSAAQDLGTKPAACLGIEDAAAGIVGLKAAGMAAIGVGDPNLLHEADWVLPNLIRFNLATYRSVA